MGFVIPERKEVADFLQEVTSRKEQALYRPGNGPKDFIPVRDFVTAFNNTQAGKDRDTWLAQPTVPVRQSKIFLLQLAVV